MIGRSDMEFDDVFLIQTKKIIDFKENNLHLVYSHPLDVYGKSTQKFIHNSQLNSSCNIIIRKFKFCKHSLKKIKSNQKKMKYL